MPYIDGFVIPVKTADRKSYIDHAKRMDKFMLENDARRIVEAWGDDVPKGKLTDFHRAVAAEAGENIVFAWIEWPDKATRDAAMKAMETNESMMAEPMPFDGKHVIFGGFEPVLVLEN